MLRFPSAAAALGAILIAAPAALADPPKAGGVLSEDSAPPEAEASEARADPPKAGGALSEDSAPPEAEAPEARADLSPWRRAAATAVAAAPAALLWLPIVRVLLIMVGATVPPAAIVPVALMGSIVTPMLAVSPRRLKWALPVSGALLALVAALVACVLRG